MARKSTFHLRLLPILTVVLMLFQVSRLSAQILPGYALADEEMPAFEEVYADNGTEACSEAVAATLKAEKQIHTGKAMLISAGCMTAVGAALYGAAWGMLSDATSVAGVFSIGGVAVMGLSVPLYISGSVLYCRGRKSLKSE